MLLPTPEKVIVAHQMDPGRRELYVEGVRDRTFFDWLIGDDMGFKTAVVPIEMVEIVGVDDGGHRERLKVFLQEVYPADLQIRGLLDLDQGGLVVEQVPPNAWLTDLRDLEGYVLGEENVDVVLRLGYGITKVSARSVIDSMSEVARHLAAVRLASKKLDLSLPISKCELKRYIDGADDGSLYVNEEAFLQALLQSANVSLRQLEPLKAAITAATADVEILPIGRIIHGKDCMKLLSIQIRALGASGWSDVAPALWSSFRRERLSDFPVLTEIVDYLTTTSPL
jgi:hypothetical protein